MQTAKHQGKHTSASLSSPKPEALCIFRLSTERMETRTFVTETCELLVCFYSTKI